jgi:hypothetical protein
MTDWGYAQQDAAEQLCRLHRFAMQKRQDGRQVEFIITVREYVTPPDPTMPFFAQADRQTNQKTAPYTPSGWGGSLLDALAQCMRAIRKFPYEGE